MRIFSISARRSSSLMLSRDAPSGFDGVTTAVFQVQQQRTGRLLALKVCLDPDNRKALMASFYNTFIIFLVVFAYLIPISTM